MFTNRFDKTRLPLDASFQSGVDTPVDRAVNKTIAEGTAIAHPLRLKEMVHALKDSGGSSVAVTEDEIIAAVNTPPAKAGGFRLRLEAGLIDPSGR